MTEAPDRAAWGPGPWDSEPDRVEWMHAGLWCVAARHPFFGTWCGYAGVPREHPLFGLDYNDPAPALEEHLERLKAMPVGEMDLTMARMIAMLSGEALPTPAMVLSVHGGVTYADGPTDYIHHAQAPAEVWYFGFDTNHCDDLSPHMEHLMRKHGRPTIPGQVYRTLEYVKLETEQLAAQLAELS